MGLAQNKEAIKLKNKINKFRQDNNIPSGFTVKSKNSSITNK